MSYGTPRPATNRTPLNEFLPPHLEPTALTATYAPRWKANTAYALGDAVLSPSGDTVTAKAAFTSGATYNAANWNLSASYPTKGGKTKTDGQNIKNLRRPVLTVDSTFPNARMDHQILFADEALGRAYALGADKGLRLQTWNPASGSQDIGAFTASPRSIASATQTWAFHGLFFRTSTGTLLMEQLDAGVVTLQRSTAAQDGNAWATVMTLPGDAIPLGPTALSQDEVTGYLYFVEYSSGTTLTEIRIMRSTDDGVTWTVFKSMPKAVSGGGGTIRHWHGTRYDSISQRVYFCAGDQNDVAGMYRVNAAGTDIEPVILNNQISAQFGLIAPARSIDVMFFPDYIAWGCDGSGGQNHIYRMARTQIGQANPVVEQVAAIDNTSWWSQKVRSDGSMWVCSASSEINGGPNPDVGISHLYAVSDNGATVDDLAAVSMEGIYGAGSLSCLSNPGSGGDTFWLRAHAYQEFPFKTNSAFQIRARVGFGAAPIIKPRNLRPAVYVSQTRNWEGALTASQTKKFAHTRTPGETRTLHILDMGVKVLSGTANSVKLQVWNATTGTLIHELTGGYQSWRQGFYATQDYAYKYLLGANDQVEFQLVETGGAAVASASAYITFGFGI